MIGEDNKLANRFSPKRVNFAPINDPKSCTSCSRSFSIVCRRHCCSKCNLNFCGKCSKTSVSTIDNNLVRERFCSKCSEECEKSSDRVDTTFTPSKLHMLNNLADDQAQILWSADSDSDSENESKNDSVSVSSIKENLMNRIKHESTTEDNKQNKSLVKDEVRFRSSTLISDILSPLSVESTDMVQRKSTQASSTSSCSQCKSMFISSSKKHKCSQCNALVCGKCSESRLNTNNKVLHRQRLCISCISITAPSLISPFTPSKLHTLNDQDISQAHTLWSVDSDTDCESEIDRSHDWKTSSKASALKKSAFLSSSATPPPVTVSNKISYSIYSPLLIMTVVVVFLLSIRYLNLHNEFLQADSLILSEQSKNFVDPYDRLTYDVLLKAHMANFRNDLDKALKAQVYDMQTSKIQVKKNSRVGFFWKIKNMLHEFDIFLKRVFHKLTHFGRQRNSVHIKILAKHR